MKRIFTVLCYLSLLWSVTSWAAQEFHWQFAGWYGGGCYPNVEFDPQVKDRVYLTSDVAGIWRSDDLGEHWYFINKGLGNLLVPQVAVAPSDSNVLYATTQGGVYVSTNAGASWKATDNPQGKLTFQRPANHQSLAIDPTDPQRVCVGTAREEIFCSTTLGEQWNKLALPSFLKRQNKPIPVVAFIKQGKSLRVGFNDLVAEFSFADKSWKQLGEFTNVSDVAELEGQIYVASGNKVWIKAPEGDQWQTTAGIPKGTAQRIALAKVDDHILLYVGWLQDWNGWVYVSHDLGASWKDLSKNIVAGGLLDPTRAWAQKATQGTALKMNPFNPKVLFRTDFWGVWRSDDGGLSWHEKILGAPNTVATDIAITPQGTLYVASMDNGLLKSEDGGENYQLVFPKTGYKDDVNGHVWRVLMAGKQVIATSSPWGKAINQVVRYDLHDEEFQISRNGLPSTRPSKNAVWGQGYPKALAVDPKDPQTLYLGIDGDDGGGLFVSKDGGSSWTRLPGQPSSLRFFHGLAVDPTDSQRIFVATAGQGGGVFLSKDQGQSFHHVLKEMEWVFNLAIASDGTVYAAGDSGGPTLYVMPAGAKQFRLLKRFPKTEGNAIDGLAIHPLNPQMIAISTMKWTNGSPCSFWLTRDGGKSWTTINGDLPDGTGASAMTFDSKGEYLYIARYAGSVYKLKI